MKKLAVTFLYLLVQTPAPADEISTRVLRSDDPVSISFYASPCEIMTHRSPPHLKRVISHFGVEIGNERLAIQAYHRFADPSENELARCEAHRKTAEAGTDEIAQLEASRARAATGSTSEDLFEPTRYAASVYLRTFNDYRGQVLSDDSPIVPDCMRSCFQYDLEFSSNGSLANRWIRSFENSSGEIGPILYRLRLIKRSVPCTPSYRIIK